MNGLRPLHLGKLNRGCVEKVIFEDLDEKGHYIDLSGKRAWFTVKTEPWDDVANDSTAVMKVEGVITEGGRVTFTLSEADTYQDPNDDYYFDIVLTDQNEANAERVALGDLIIIGGANNAQAGGDN